jgi:cell wall-associated NlpC family hydrolase
MIVKYTEEEVLTIRERIIVEAKKLLNVPYSHRGRTRFGIDCLGLPWLAYKRAGIDYLPDNDGKAYGVNWHWSADSQRYLDAILKYFDPTENLTKGDLILFKTTNEFFTHGAIYIDNDLFIHARSGKKVKFDNIKTHRYWKNCITKFLIFKGFK